MAAIEISDNGHGNVRSRKISTRVDMTPMVDLGFLLITFFMLATTMTKPTAMSVFFPDKSTPGTQPIGASGVLTLFLAAHDEIYYLDGIAPDDDRATASLKMTHAGHELRTIIFDARLRVGSLAREKGEGNKELVVVIKPTRFSNYKNMVDVLDEMAITKLKRYALVDDLTSSEKKILGDRVTDVK